MKKIIDLGKIGITLAGEYNDKTIYEKLTIVLYKGKSYISTKTVQGISPTQDIRSWQLVAEAKDAYHMLVDAGKTTLTEEEFLEQLVDATKGRYIVQGNIINAADEEDLTVEHSDLLGVDTLKLANRDNTKGMGYVILRKNKSFAEQVTKENTIYEIRYNFILNENINIPANCILKFDGGNISGEYTITGNNTRLSGNLKGIFTGVTIDPQGTWKVKNISSDFFTDITNANRILNLIPFTSDNYYNEIVIENGNYSIDATVAGYSRMYLKSNTTVIVNGNINLYSNNAPSYAIFQIENKYNITIKGSGNLIGDRDNNTATGEWGWCIYCINVSNITVDGITCSKPFGDGIYFDGICNNIIIRNCIFNNCRRNAVAIKFGSNFILENNVFKNTYGISPQCALEIELDTEVESNNIENIFVLNNVFENNIFSIILNNSKATSYISNVYIENNIFRDNKGILDTSEWGTKDNEHVKNITFINNIVENKTVTYGYLFYLWGKNILFKNNYIKDEVGGSFGLQLNCSDSVFENNYMYFYLKDRAIIITSTAKNVLIKNNNIIRDRVDSTNIILESVGPYNSIVNNNIEGRIAIKGKYAIFSNNNIKLQPGGDYGVYIKGDYSVLEYNDIDANGDTINWLYYLQANYCKLYRNKANNDNRYLILHQASNNIIQCYDLIGSTRPTVGIGAGSIFIDTSFIPAKMIYHNGSDWVNMDGSALS